MNSSGSLDQQDHCADQQPLRDHDLCNIVISDAAKSTGRLRVGACRWSSLVLVRQQME
jgi:hypothetical protein